MVHLVCGTLGVVQQLVTHTLCAMVLEPAMMQNACYQSSRDRLWTAQVQSLSQHRRSRWFAYTNVILTKLTQRLVGVVSTITHKLPAGMMLSLVRSQTQLAARTVAVLAFELSTNLRQAYC